MSTTPSMEKPSDAARERYDRLLQELGEELDVAKVSMFGMPSIKRREGKAFAGLYGEDMVFKLAGDAHAEALALEGAHPFEPMAGRPMKAWVVVPPTHEDRYVDLAKAAEAAL